MRLSCSVPFFFSILSFSIPSLALIPRVCRHNLTRPDATCCPTPPGADLPCGGPLRGRCGKIQVYHPPEKLHHIVINDDRIFWPTRLFRYACQCEGNFWGYACHECWYGWTGPDCSMKHISVRRNIASYSAQEKQLFMKVMVKSHEIPSKEYVIFEEKFPGRSDPLVAPRFILDASLHQMLIFVHRYASRSTQYHNPRTCSKVKANFDFNHGGVGFVTWHRFFMLFWERQAAKLAREEFGVEDFRFPYWDWTDAKECEVCIPELVGDLSHPYNFKNPSPFIGWVNYCGPPDGNPCAACHTRLQNKGKFVLLKRRWRSNAMFPTWAQLSFVLSRPRYYVPGAGHQEICTSFTHAIEGTCAPPGNRDDYLMHNGVHNAVDGPFSTSSGSTNDPLFPMHHLQIDRIFQRWFQRHQPHIFTMPNRNMKYGHCRDCNMVGFIPSLPHRAMLVDTRALGYVYDSLNFGRNRTI